jgi:heptosyltransferase I
MVVVARINQNTPDPAYDNAGICVMRLSAIGDVAHTVALVRALQDGLPHAPLCWLVGRVEAAVARLVPGVEIVVVDKKQPLRELWRLRRQFRHRRFDALLHLQVSFRSNLMSLGVPARRRIGFDPARARDAHRWVINETIEPAPAPGEHVIDGFMRFARAVGVKDPRPRWDIVLPTEDVAWAQQVVPRERRVLAIAVCASRPERDWPTERLVEVVRWAAESHGLHVALCGGRSEREQERAAAISAQAGRPVANLVGRTTLPQLMALLQRAEVLVSPDSGPAHLATAVGTPVVGLYGVSNVRRSGPYLSQHWCVDKRGEAARILLGRPAESLAWAEHVVGGMDLIQVDDVRERIEAVLAVKRTPR